jgi:hypothetical protein
MWEKKEILSLMLGQLWFHPGQGQDIGTLVSEVPHARLLDAACDKTFFSFSDWRRIQASLVQVQQRLSETSVKRGDKYTLREARNAETYSK